jgi:membrane associated rhomboid family serine protease
MFPLNDTEPNRYSAIPVMTILLIAVNTVILFAEPWTVAHGNYWAYYMKYASTPRLIIEMKGAGFLSSITSMFLHGGISHLLGNMLALWVFGRRVEDACGPLRFLAFYLTVGVAADIISTIVQYNSPLPSIGASGAVFGVMGAYLFLYPAGRIRTLVFITFVPLWPRLRAFWVVFYFLGVQLIPAIEILYRKADYNVNYWAHLGGFAASILVFLYLRPQAYARYLSDVPV